MATYFLCDGCAKPVDAPKKVGHTVRREYCEACVVIANEFIEAEEALRRETQERFIDERAALIARFSADGFKLPDLPT